MRSAILQFLLPSVSRGKSSNFKYQQSPELNRNKHNAGTLHTVVNGVCCVGGVEVHIRSTPTFFILRNTKGSVYCQYGQYGLTFRALALRRRDECSDEGPMLETLDYTIRIGSTPAFLYFDLYLYSAYAAHYVYFFYTSLCT